MTMKCSIKPCVASTAECTRLIIDMCSSHEAGKLLHVQPGGQTVAVPRCLIIWWKAAGLTPYLNSNPRTSQESGFCTTIARSVLQNAFQLLHMPTKSVLKKSIIISEL